MTGKRLPTGEGCSVNVDYTGKKLEDFRVEVEQLPPDGLPGIAYKHTVFYKDQLWSTDFILDKDCVPPLAGDMTTEALLTKWILNTIAKRIRATEAKTNFHEVFEDDEFSEAVGTDVPERKSETFKMTLSLEEALDQAIEYLTEEFPE